MRARRDAILTVLCALLVACSAVASAPPSSHDPTIEGVGVLPASSPDSSVVVTTGASVPESTEAAADSTTTLPPAPPIGTLVTGNRLLMIGDSITASAAKRYGGELCDALVPLGWQVEVDAEVSRFIDFGNQVLDRRLASGWDAAYVFLGTNYFGDQESYRKQLEKIVGRLAPTPVVLLTVTLFEDSRQQVNDAITLVGAEFSNVRVLDWGSIAAANADTILRGDGHHLTDEGRAQLASTVAGVMGEAPTQPGKCLGTSFSNDSGGSVNGSDAPPKRKVGKPTPTTIAKAAAVSTTVASGSPTSASVAAVTTVFVDTVPVVQSTTPKSTTAPPTSAARAPTTAPAASSTPTP